MIINFQVWKLLYLNKMKFSELIEHAIECLKTFNPVIKTIDSHADEMIAKVRATPTYWFVFLWQFTDPYEKVFVKQVFYGCTRYQEFLKVSISHDFLLIAKVLWKFHFVCL